MMNRTSEFPHGRPERLTSLDRSEAIRLVRQALKSGGSAEARDLINADYPFAPVAYKRRSYGEIESFRIFARDGFIDRYSGQRLVFPGVLRLFSWLFPHEFPYHPNWKISATHPAYWELSPSIDHVLPIARGGLDDDTNMVTTSMLRNAAKAWWTLDELGWNLHDPGYPAYWEGLTTFFMEFVDADRSLLKVKYLQRWHRAASLASEAVCRINGQ